ncbi:MAG: peptidase inhibitor family I36 protein [Rhizobacter sp.]
MTSFFSLNWRRVVAIAALLGASPVVHAADGVCLYEHVNYQGASWCTDADVGYVGAGWNDRASSVKVRSGHAAELYQHANHAGRSIKLTGDTPNLVALQFNDSLSSLRLSKADAACNASSWTPGVNYPLGTVVKYLPTGGHYKVVNVAANGSDGTNPTISTWYWAPTSCGAPPAGGLPAKVVAGYYPDWKPAPLRIRDMNPRYNVIYLFAARPLGGPPGTTGAVTWTAPGDGRGAATHLVADIQHARTVQKRKIMLSVGGAGQGMNFPNRTKSRAFVDSIVAIHTRLGGIDGLDWNTFEADQAPDTAEMIWISLELKRLFPGFIISAPPAPWKAVDKAFCKQMVEAGAMDYCAPQYYDGPDLANPDYVVNNVKEWVALLGAARVVVGFGIHRATNYMTPEQGVATWKRVAANHPGIRGGFDWETSTDEEQGWPFANGVGPLINP